MRLNDRLGYTVARRAVRLLGPGLRVSRRRDTVFIGTHFRIEKNPTDRRAVCKDTS